MMVRELGFGLNPAISTTTPLSDINFYERKLGSISHWVRSMESMEKNYQKQKSNVFILMFLWLLQVYILAQNEYFKMENGSSSDSHSAPRIHTEQMLRPSA